MSLIFTDTLQASDATGLYTLQALINGTWTDLHSISGPQSGSIEVDATLNTIAVDTTLLAAGSTFDFRWIDNLQHQSNTRTLTIPCDINIALTVVNTSTFSITIDGIGVIDWGDSTGTTPYDNGIATAMTHSYAPGIYAMQMQRVSGLTHFELAGDADYYSTGVDFMPDTLVYGDFHNNRIGDSGLPNGPNPLGLLTANLSGNVFSSALIDALINQAFDIWPLIHTMALQGQTPPAPPTSASATALAQLLARGVTVTHD